MKRALSILLTVLLLCALVACQSEEDKKFDELTGQNSAASSQASSPESAGVSQAGEEKHLSGELRISAVFSDEIEMWANRFRAAYPDVTVTVEEAFDLERDMPSDWAQQYAQTTAVELVGGESADLVEVGMLSFYKYAQSGLFMDYYELMGNDPDFHQEDYYTNIFQALEGEDGGLYALPVYFTYTMLVLNDYMLLRVEPDLGSKYKDGIGYKDVISLFQKGRELGEIPENALFAERQNKLFFEGFVFPKFMDEKKGEARFDSPEFIEYLEKTDALPFDTRVGGAVTYTPDLPDFSPDNFFCQQVPLSADTFENITMNRMLAGQSRPLFYKDEEGDAPFSASNLWAIPKGGNTELAWEFMKFVVGEREFPQSLSPESLSDKVEYFLPYTNQIPINRKNFLNLYGAAFDKGLTEEVDEYCQTLNMRTGASSELMSNLMEILESYYNSHLISAEECAKQMQERAEIYLNE